MPREHVRNVRLQERVAASGWTHEQFVALINEQVYAETGQPGSYSPESIRRLLSGLHTWPHHAYRAAMCAIFQCDPADLGFVNLRAARTLRPVDPEEDDDVRRQEFLRLTATASLVAVLPGCESAPAPTRADVAPRRAGDEHVRRIEGRAAVYRQADDAGLGFSSGIEAELRVARAYLQAQMTPAVARQMTTAVATFHRVAGWACYDRGEHARAREHFDTGLALLGDDGSWWLRAAILTCLARQAIYRGDIDQALTRLGEVSIRADKLSMLRRADIAAVKARAFGAAGNHRECLRAVTEAEGYFTEAGNEDHPDLRYEAFDTYYGRTLLDSDIGASLFDLAFTHGAEVSEAVDRLRATQQLSDEHARSRLLSGAHLAALLLRHGDIDEGVALAEAVLDQAQASTSARLTTDIRRIHRLTTASRIKQAPGVPTLRRKSRALLHTL
jgi:hypothetical protein